MVVALLESRDQRLQCPATMTHRVLLLRRGLAEGLAQLQAEKQGVVPKPAGPPWRVEDRALAHTLKNVGDGTGLADEDEHTPVARPATLRLTVQRDGRSLSLTMTPRPLV